VTSGASIDRPISLRKHQNSKAGAFFADRAGAPPESTKWSKMTHLRQILRLRPLPEFENWLVEMGLWDKDKLMLTEKAGDFFPVVVALLAWGNRHLAPKGESIMLANRSDARPFDPIVVDAADMRPITLANAVVVPGPRASRGMRKRLGSLKAMNPAVAPAGD